MMIAFDADAKVSLEFQVVDDFAAARTFGPEPSGKLALLIRCEDRFAEDPHLVVLIGRSGQPAGEASKGLPGCCLDDSCWLIHPRATVTTRTEAAPARRSTRLHSSTVLPVVNTSSTSTI